MFDEEKQDEFDSDLAPQFSSSLYVPIKAQTEYHMRTNLIRGCNGPGASSIRCSNNPIHLNIPSVLLFSTHFNQLNQYDPFSKYDVLQVGSSDFSNPNIVVQSLTPVILVPLFLVYMYHVCSYSNF